MPFIRSHNSQCGYWGDELLLCRFFSPNGTTRGHNFASQATGKYSLTTQVMGVDTQKSTVRPHAETSSKYQIIYWKPHRSHSNALCTPWNNIPPPRLAYTSHQQVVWPFKWLAVHLNSTISAFPVVTVKRNRNPILKDWLPLTFYNVKLLWSAGKQLNCLKAKAALFHLHWMPLKKHFGFNLVIFSRVIRITGL